MSLIQDYVNRVHQERTQLANILSNSGITTIDQLCQRINSIQNVPMGFLYELAEQKQFPRFNNTSRALAHNPLVGGSSDVGSGGYLTQDSNPFNRGSNPFDTRPPPTANEKDLAFMKCQARVIELEKKCVEWEEKYNEQEDKIKELETIKTEKTQALENTTQELTRVKQELETTKPKVEELIAKNATNEANVSAAEAKCATLESE